jgi:hypothetical protein
VAVAGGVASAEEESELSSINDWIEGTGLPRGVMGYDFADDATGQQRAIFDLAWPSGLQPELSQPVALLLNEDAATVSLASQAGYRCFTDGASFRQYVERDLLAGATNA